MKFKSSMKSNAGIVCGLNLEHRLDLTQIDYTLLTFRISRDSPEKESDHFIYQGLSAPDKLYSTLNQH